MGLRLRTRCRWEVSSNEEIVACSRVKATSSTSTMTAAVCRLKGLSRRRGLQGVRWWDLAQPVILGCGFQWSNEVHMQIRQIDDLKRRKTVLKFLSYLSPWWTLWDLLFYENISRKLSRVHFVIRYRFLHTRASDLTETGSPLSCALNWRIPLLVPRLLSVHCTAINDDANGSLVVSARVLVFF